ncbi:uncharacterized protein METZ01_LOCUS99552 [marine metagenome]|uniref:Lon N-terminal domain-containing protein n=1 Tax=marine metagenome TaxID=408172 RepID=A0A381W3Y9_9ZZZZ
MTSEPRRLPLFPLHTVLFPGATIPLQVFEERYKEMMKVCLESDGRFGVVLIKDGQEVGGSAIPHDIGTIAKVLTVSESSMDRLYITAIGEERFQILEIVEDKPFITALVVADEKSQKHEVSIRELDLAKETVSKHVSYLLSMRGGWMNNTYAPSDPLTLSYFLAQILQVDMNERQRLLAMDSCEGRLTTCRAHIDKESSKIALRASIELSLKFSRQ